MLSELALRTIHIEPRKEAKRYSSETAARRIRRWTLGALYDLKPPRHRDVPAIVRRWLRYQALPREQRAGLPSLAGEPIGFEGLVGFSSNMSVANMRKAYAQGLYPMTHYGTVRWYTPQLRAVLDIKNFHLRSELRRKLRRPPFQVTFDREPEAVMAACAEPRKGQWPLTWITDDVIEAYLGLYEEGFMHSVEVWDREGHLVGGLFGTRVGSVFVIESLFHKVSHSSKYGLAVLAAHLQAWGFGYLDNKIQTPHTATLGFCNIPREAYRDILAERPGVLAPERHWKVDESLDLGRWKPASGPPPRLGC